MQNHDATFSLGTEILQTQRQAQWHKLRSLPLLWVGGAVLLLLVVLSHLMPALATDDQMAMQVAQRLKAPSALHLFGTDDFGRDLWFLVFQASRNSVWIGASVALGSCVLGTVFGLYAAYYRALDVVLMRICDALISIPGILLAIFFTTALGSHPATMVGALIIVYTPLVARVTRAQAQVIKNQRYVEAALIQGARPQRIIWTILFPALFSTLSVQATYLFAQAILSEAALSFLGAGIPASEASLGTILQAGKQVFTKAPWMIVVPGGVLILWVLSFNLFGDGLRDLLDPHLRPKTSQRRFLSRFCRSHQAEGA